MNAPKWFKENAAVCKKVNKWLAKDGIEKKVRDVVDRWNEKRCQNCEQREAEKENNTNPAANSMNMMIAEIPTNCLTY